MNNAEESKTFEAADGSSGSQKCAEEETDEIDAPKTVLKTSAKGSSSDVCTTLEETKQQVATVSLSNNPPEVVAETASDQQAISEDNVASASEYDVKNVQYIDGVAIYTDPKSGCQYEWDKEKKEWILKNTVTYGFEDDTHTYTDTDGTTFFWDKEKHAWFPKITDDFMAQYQMSYGFTDNTSDTQEIPKTDTITESKIEENEKREEKIGVKRKPSAPTWFEVNDDQNTKVYVSNLPEEYTEEEFVDVMQKCGLVMRDPSTGKMKVKLYRDSEGRLKGDALCTYIRVESVDLALKLLDGYDFKSKKIKVEKAQFQMKGEYDPKLKPKMKKRKDKQKLKRMQEKLFDWRPEKMIGERAKHERIVIVRNLFEPSLFDQDVGLILEFQQDLREECSKCGEVRKVILYDRHPEGVAQINMSCPEEADECVNLLNGRWFGKRKITAEIWDGKTKFKIAETDAEISQRIDKWDEFLEADSTTEEKSAA